jgi:hypothetical protein
MNAVVIDFADTGALTAARSFGGDADDVTLHLVEQRVLAPHASSLHTELAIIGTFGGGAPAATASIGGVKVTSRGGSDIFIATFTERGQSLARTVLTAGSEGDDVIGPIGFWGDRGPGGYFSLEEAWLSGLAGTDPFSSSCREPTTSACTTFPFVLGLRFPGEEVADVSLLSGCNVEVRAIDLGDGALLWGHHGTQASLDTPRGTLRFADPPVGGSAAFFARIANVAAP